jgi:hypothetical protein
LAGALRTKACSEIGVLCKYKRGVPVRVRVRVTFRIRVRVRAGVRIRVKVRTKIRVRDGGRINIFKIAGALLANACSEIGVLCKYNRGVLMRIRIYVRVRVYVWGKG